MKNKKRRKKIIILIIIIFVITLSYNTITYKTEKTKEENNKVTTQKDYITDNLEKLNYSKEDILTIKKYVSEKNINYLINNKIDNNISMGFINEKYYIDDYLEKYINYHNQKNKSFSETITIINTHIDNEFYSNTIKTDTTLGKYVILNKYYYADNTYPNEQLISVPGKYHINGTSVKLTKECYEAFLLMFQDAYNAGYGFKLKSAYRSYDTQVNTYNYWKSLDGIEKADTYSARAGFSEHQTGYAFDIRDYDYKYEDYSKSESFKWVSTNAHKYGFIIRFPEGKEHITGYQYESWHYRYCGIECATYIYENDITYEEYYEYFIKYQNPKNLT